MLAHAEPSVTKLHGKIKKKKKLWIRIANRLLVEHTKDIKKIKRKN